MNKKKKVSVLIADDQTLFREGIKWAATLLLCIGYTLCARPGKGGMLAYFRWFVTKGLLTR